LGGWRPGRNPPSVRGDICLIGIPAPQTAFIGTYYPFHNAGRRFTLAISLLDVFASSSLTDAGFLSVSSPGLSPDVSRRRASVLWVEFPQAEARKSPTGSPTTLGYAAPQYSRVAAGLTLPADFRVREYVKHVLEALDFARVWALFFSSAP
jgi:hypothetical protein